MPHVESYEPVERLTRVGDFLLDCLADCPDYRLSDKLVILVVADNEGGIAARGYETHDDTIRDMARFLTTVIRDDA
jgi:hypothetical protein